jgi:hypothetical protein
MTILMPILILFDINANNITPFSTFLFMICMHPYWILHLPFLSGQFLHNFFLCMDVNDIIHHISIRVISSTSYNNTIYDECIKFIQYISQYYISTDIQVKFITLCPILTMHDIQVIFITLCPILTMIL